MTETQRILLVDDEINILNSLKRLLRREDYECLTTNNGNEALSILKEKKIHVVISDQRMPEMTGVELLQKVKVISPDTIRVVLSGYAEIASIVESINKGEIYRFLTKPWNDEELKTDIRQCLEYYNITNLNRELLKRISMQNKELQRMNIDLEKMVEMRTYSLKMSQDLLEALPISLIGVDMDARMILTNEAAQEEFPSLANEVPGTKIEQMLPPEAVKLAKDCLSGKICPKTLIPWQNKNVTFQVKIVKSGEMVRGCIFILFPENGGLK